VLLAEGFEEIEATTIVDVLRRAEVDVVVLGVSGREVRGAHGITVLADRPLAEGVDEAWDMVTLPGGLPGATNLRDHAGVQALIRKQVDAGRAVAAVCAAPIALASAGVLTGRRATSYPGFADQMPGAIYEEERVVVDGNITTSRGPGTALPFALELAAQLCGSSVATALRRGMLVET
jgi:4-methyl-5(b-hydroxyethyl)-thiazole monophosphate biosynthesis